MTTIDRINAANALLEGTTIAPIALPQAPARKARTHKAKGLDWTLRPATIGQHDRIARAEEAILASGRKRGIALIHRGINREAAMSTGGTASAYYKTLATFTRKHSIDF